LYYKNDSCNKESLYLRGVVFNPEEKFICEYFIPPLPIKKTCYECGHRFKTETIINLFPDNYKTYGLLLISGEEVNYYELESADVLQPNKIASVTIHRLKKQKKGGQSAPRFQRTQLQQIIEWRKKIVDMLNKNVKNKIEGIIIGGIGDLRDSIKSHDDLYSSIRNKIKYVIPLASIEIQLVLPIIKPYIMNINVDEEKKTIAKIQELIVLDPDILLFGEKEIKEKLELKLIKTIYVNQKSENILKDYNINNVEIIKINDKILESWGSIVGVLRFKLE